MNASNLCRKSIFVGRHWSLDGLCIYEANKHISDSLCGNVTLRSR